jgi:hypothetical protein
MINSSQTETIVARGMEESRTASQFKKKKTTSST